MPIDMQYEDKYGDDIDADPIEDPNKRWRYAIAIFHRDGLRYGGPEEGGWWYETGSLMRVVRTTRSLELAMKLCRRANERLDYMAKRDKVRDVSSVSYAGGRYHASVEAIDENKGFSISGGYPEHRPRYE